jgi:hypothetical protein
LLEFRFWYGTFLTEAILQHYEAIRLQRTVRNAGTAALQISAVNLAGYTPEDSHMTGNTYPASLAPSATCKVSFVFAPVEVGGADAEIQFSTSDPDAAEAASVLFGNAVALKSAH